MIAPARAAGADCSHFHPVVDWSALEGSVSFLGVKATQSLTYVDPMFTKHRDGFRASSVPLAIWYHYAVPGDAGAQARALARAVGDLRPNERLCLDLEQVVVPGGDTLSWVDTFFSTIMGGACRGSRPFLYTSARIWKAIGNPLWDLAPEVDLWLPRYQSGSDEPEIPRGWQHWTIWQQSQGAIVPGIQGPCDSDLFNGSDADVRAYAGLPSSGVH